jgi:hypothetical protein
LIANTIHNIIPLTTHGFTSVSQMYALSDEELVARWVENPYWQYFSGKTYLQPRKPCDSLQLSRWRKRIGEEKLKLTIQETIRIAKARVRYEYGNNVSILKTNDKNFLLISHFGKGLIDKIL